MNRRLNDSDEGWDYPAAFRCQTQVGSDDIDALQHTNNTVYVRWCEAAAWEHSAALGLDLASYLRLDRAMAVVEGRYRYLQPSHLGDQVVTGTWILHWDQRLSMTRHFQIRRVADGATLLRAEVRFACIEISTGKPRRLPAEFREGYGPAILPASASTASSQKA